MGWFLVTVRLLAEFWGSSLLEHCRGSWPVTEEVSVFI